MRILLPSLLLALGLATAASVSANERRFTYLYETTTMPQGKWEIEPWTTWKHYATEDKFEFRYELEYGVTDRFQLAAYLSDWSYSTSDAGDETKWKTAGLEAVYSLSNPTTDALGSALYAEVLYGPEKFAVEGKILLQKNVGPFVFVYNGVLEAEWEGKNYDEKVGVWENILGVSYELNPSLMVGLEAKHEVEFAEWEDAGENVVFVGPNISYRGRNFYATLTALFQATDVEGEPESQVRLLMGFDF